MQSYIFDIGGVLVNFDIRRLLENIAAQQQCQTDEIEEIFHPDWVYRVETGKISSLEYFHTHVRRFVKQMSYDEWIAAWMANYSLNQPGVRLLEQAREKGFPTYLLSNLAEHHKIAIEKKFPGFFDRSDRNFFSYNLGLFKPELAIYREVCRQIQQEPEQCIFFDDTAVNVTGAIEAGMKAFQFSNEQIETILHELSQLKAAG